VSRPGGEGRRADAARTGYEAMIVGRRFREFAVDEAFLMARGGPVSRRSPAAEGYGQENGRQAESGEETAIPGPLRAV
jgi:hypothetical protein